MNPRRSARSSEDPDAAVADLSQGGKTLTSQFRLQELSESPAMTTTQDPARKSDGEEHLVATFLLGDAAFGVAAGEIQEVVRPGFITPVHHAASHVVGIRNLRGRIVTVIDLGAWLQLGGATAGPESRVLIVEWHNESLGVLVDRVADTIAVDPAAIEPAPGNVHGVQARNLRGVFRGVERLVALLDLGAALDTSH
ncbi:MAG: chemotaxis protein CheW [Myxococcales bacterium]